MPVQHETQDAAGQAMLAGHRRHVRRVVLHAHTGQVERLGDPCRTIIRVQVADHQRRRHIEHRQEMRRRFTVELHRLGGIEVADML